MFVTSKVVDVRNADERDPPGIDARAEVAGAVVRRRDRRDVGAGGERRPRERHQLGSDQRRELPPDLRLQLAEPRRLEERLDVATLVHLGRPRAGPARRRPVDVEDVRRVARQAPDRGRYDVELRAVERLSGRVVDGVDRRERRVRRSARPAQQVAGKRLVDAVGEREARDGRHREPILGTGCRRATVRPSAPSGSSKRR